ncbi:hypothetical protein DV702_09800 [Sporosarcina sp. PTS2304]|uniref:hypothetical protein n=1 Tax=Sporosarcina sp. PTS2304 TaxID=2283194 RepID=UPI000E0D2282|nr:hypothetical protein [Sporosarcina sp. PTS2304]AXH99988.1 hypothetical protein DV702_09800 [Sporosarcina sp. PTS2304]
MDSLQKKLQREIQQQADIQIQQSDSWGLPIEIVSIPYTTIKRTTMDILMKMILVTVQKLEVSKPQMIADFLAVEPLFVEDLVRRMENAQLVEQRKQIYRLTKKGVRQLQAGVYEHPPEKKMKKLFYSPFHNKLLSGIQEDVQEKKIKKFRLITKHRNGAERLAHEHLRTALLLAGAEEAEGPLQIVIEKIEVPVTLETQLVPCVEFYVYNRAEDRYYTRVWNTLTEQWDERLENVIDELDPLKKIT